MTIVRSTEEIDRALAGRGAEVAAMSATLIELESHPGLAHVRRYPPTGVTAQRWTVAERALAQLWEDLGRLTSILDTARKVRARRSTLDDVAREELTALLFGRPIEVSRRRVPLTQRTITGPAERVESVGVADLVARMRTDYPVVAAFLDEVDGVITLVATGLASPQRQLDQSGAVGLSEITELLTLSASDPLSLTPGDVERRVSAIADLAALQADWPTALASTDSRLDTLRARTRRAAQIRAQVQQVVVAGPLPVHADAEPDLRAALRSIVVPDPVALRAIRLRTEEALRIVGEDEQLAQGLLDRHGELNGRLTAYQAKAARLGLGEDRDLLACGRIAAGLLARRPCDLRAVTRAVVDYQQMLLERQGDSR